MDIKEEVTLLSKLRAILAFILTHLAIEAATWVFIDRILGGARHNNPSTVPGATMDEISNKDFKRSDLTPEQEAARVRYHATLELRNEPPEVIDRPWQFATKYHVEMYLMYDYIPYVLQFTPTISGVDLARWDAAIEVMKRVKEAIEKDPSSSVVDPEYKGAKAVVYEMLGKFVTYEAHLRKEGMPLMDWLTRLKLEILEKGDDLYTSGMKSAVRWAFSGGKPPEEKKDGNVPPQPDPNAPSPPPPPPPGSGNTNPVPPPDPNKKETAAEQARRFGVTVWTAIVAALTWLWSSAGKVLSFIWGIVKRLGFLGVAIMVIFFLFFLPVVLVIAFLLLRAAWNIGAGILGWMWGWVTWAFGAGTEKVKESVKDTEVGVGRVLGVLLLLVFGVPPILWGLNVSGYAVLSFFSMLMEVVPSGSRGATAPQILMPPHQVIVPFLGWAANGNLLQMLLGAAAVLIGTLFTRGIDRFLPAPVLPPVPTDAPPEGKDADVVPRLIYEARARLHIALQGEFAKNSLRLVLATLVVVGGSWLLAGYYHLVAVTIMCFVLGAIILALAAEARSFWPNMINIRDDQGLLVMLFGFVPRVLAGLLVIGALAQMDWDEVGEKVKHAPAATMSLASASIPAASASTNVPAAKVSKACHLRDVAEEGNPNFCVRNPGHDFCRKCPRTSQEIQVQSEQPVVSRRVSGGWGATLWKVGILVAIVAAGWFLWQRFGAAKKEKHGKHEKK